MPHASWIGALLLSLGSSLGAGVDPLAAVTADPKPKQRKPKAKRAVS